MSETKKTNTAGRTAP